MYNPYMSKNIETIGFVVFVVLILYIVIHLVIKYVDDNREYMSNYTIYGPNEKYMPGSAETYTPVIPYLPYLQKKYNYPYYLYNNYNLSYMYPYYYYQYPSSPYNRYIRHTRNGSYDIRGDIYTPKSPQVYLNSEL